MAVEAIEEYKSSLADLTFNSKPLINMLTMLADDNKEHAAEIVKVVESQLQKVSSSRKLPILYLIDSIIKNVQGSRYLHHFSGNIVATFCGVFEKVDEKTRQSLYKLRQTWSSLFPNARMYSLDKAVVKLDPAWPITATTPPAESNVAKIHVNPKFIIKKEEEEQKRKAELEKKDEPETQEQVMRQQLLAKQQELLRLQQQRIELELQEAKSRLENEAKKLQLQEEKLKQQVKAIPGPSIAQRDPRKSRDPRVQRDPRGTPPINTPPLAATPPQTDITESSQALVTPLLERLKEAVEAPWKDKPNTATQSSKPSRSSSQEKARPHKGKAPKMDPRGHKNVPLLEKNVKAIDTRKEKTGSERAESGSSSPASSTSSTRKKSRNERNYRGRRSNSASDEEGSRRRRKSRSRSPRSRRSPRSEHDRRSPRTQKTSDEKGGSKEKEVIDSKKVDGVRSSPGHEGHDSNREVVDSRRERERERRKDTRDMSRREGRIRDEEPPSKKQRATSEDKADIRGRGREPRPGDRDYKIPRLAPGLNREVDEGRDVIPPASPVSQGWAKFKADRPSDFPYRQPRMFSPTSERSAPHWPENEDIFDSDLMNLDVPPHVLHAKADRIAERADRQLMAGAMTELQHRDLLMKLDELVRLHSLHMSRDGKNRSFPPDDGRRWEGARPRGPLLPLPPTGFRPEFPSEPPQEMPRRHVGNDGFGPRSNFRSDMPQDVPAQRDVQWLRGPPRDEYDREKYYVPTLDQRWTSVTSSYQEGSGPDSIHQLNVNFKSFDLPYCNRGRSIPLGKTRVEIRACTATKRVFVGPVVYQIGDPPLPCEINGFNYTISYSGPVKKMWMDGVGFEIPLDGPPETVHIDKEPFMIFLDSLTGDVVINGHFACKIGETQQCQVGNRMRLVTFEAPSRQIRIDGELCKLSFQDRFPCIVISGKKRGIRFDGSEREVFINGERWLVPMDRPIKARISGNRPRFISFGGPGHELIIDGEWHNLKFGDEGKKLRVGTRVLHFRLPGFPPEVKILGDMMVEEVEINRICREFRRQWREANEGPGVRPMQPPPRPPVILERAEDPEAGYDAPYTSRGREWKVRNRGRGRGMQGARHESRAMMNAKPDPRGSVAGNARNLFPGLAPAPMADAGPAQHTGALTFANPMVVHTNPGLTNSTFPSVMNGVPAPTMNSMVNLSGVSGAAPAPQVDVSDLLLKLMASGVIGAQGDKGSETKEVKKEEAKKPSSNNNQDSDEEEEELEEIPDLTDLKKDKLRKLFTGAYQRLYIGTQCSNCGARFLPQEVSRYKEHLDWHFRQNKRDKQDVKVARYRKWYYSLSDWVQFEEIGDMENRAQSSVFETMMKSGQEEAQGTTDTPNETESVSCPAATGNEEEDICEICREEFEQFWDEDEEEWHLKDAVRVKGKTYHPMCYEDAKDSTGLDTSLPSTASPSANPTTNPLLSVAPLSVEPITNIVPSTTPPSADPITNPLGYLTALAEQSRTESPTLDSEQGGSTPVQDEHDDGTDIPTVVKTESVRVDLSQVKSSEPIVIKPETM